MILHGLVDKRLEALMGTQEAARIVLKLLLELVG